MPSDDAIYAGLAFIWDRPPDNVDLALDGVKVLDILRRHSILILR
jgi:hypothetical protein